MEDLNIKLTQFLQANMPQSIINPADTAWVVELFKKTKAQQKAEFVAWLNERKTANTDQIGVSDSQNTARKTALSAENTAIDNIIATF